MSIPMKCHLNEALRGIQRQQPRGRSRSLDAGHEGNGAIESHGHIHLPKDGPDPENAGKFTPNMLDFRKAGIEHGDDSEMTLNMA